MKLPAKEDWLTVLITISVTTQIMFLIAMERVKLWLDSNAHPQMSFLQMRLQESFYHIQDFLFQVLLGLLE